MGPSADRSPENSTSRGFSKTMAGSIPNSATVSKVALANALLWGILAACSADPFPDCCDLTGDRDVPYTATYRFGFQTGATDISAANNAAGLLGILSQADVLTLMNAAAVTQSTQRGLLSGTLNGLQGPLR